MLSEYMYSLGLQTVADYLTTLPTHCPPVLLLRGLLVPVSGVESGSHTTPVTQSLATQAAGGFTGNVISRSAAYSTQDNLIICITSQYFKAELSRLYKEAFWRSVL